MKLISQEYVTLSCKIAVGMLSFCAVFGGIGLSPDLALGQAAASPDRGSAARGHYARARALLVEALEEFEQGRKLARPDLLIDTEEWRISVISRTEELNRIIAPQPRVTAGGVRFRANNRLIGHRKFSTASQERARDSNTYGEQQRALELSQGQSLSTASDSIQESHSYGGTKVDLGAGSTGSLNDYRDNLPNSQIQDVVGYGSDDGQKNVVPKSAAGSDIEDMPIEGLTGETGGDSKFGYYADEDFGKLLEERQKQLREQEQIKEQEPKVSEKSPYDLLESVE